MKVNMKYDVAYGELIADLLRSVKVLESEQESTMQRIGKVIKKRVQENLPITDIDHTHMKKDIKIAVAGKKSKTGITGVRVYGGTWTGYKWHMLDSGTRNPDGTIHTPATHFVSKALQEATPEIESIIDEVQRKVVEA